MSLNKQQEKAVNAPLKPVLVIAGAGTGKTRVLVNRFKHLVDEKNISPDEIVVVAFTNKAAEEMEKRISKIFEGTKHLRKIKVSTFHEFCRDVLRSEGRNFKVCTDFMAVKYVKEAIERLNLPLKANNECTDLILKVKWFQNAEEKQATYWELIRAAKKCTKLTDEKLAEKYPFEEFKKIWFEYERILREKNLLHHDEQLYEVDKLLKNEEKRSKWDGKIKAILFDEFQDIDPIQFRIITNLSKDIRNIFCVGDPDQAIYGFREAMPSAFEKFQNVFKDAEIIKLETNYRSTIQILDVVNELINKKKSVFSKNLVSDSNNKSGAKVKVFVANSPNREVDYIANNIEELNNKYQVDFKKIAVLFRNWAFGWRVNDVFVQRKIPFYSKDLKNFWRREEVQDCLAYIYLSFERDPINIDNALKRIINKPSRGIGKKTFDLLKKEAQIAGMPLVKYILLGKNTASNVKCRQFASDIDDLRNIAKEEKINLRNRIERILSYSGIQKYYEKIDFLREKNINFLLTFIFQQELQNYDEFKERLYELTKTLNDNNGVYLSTIHSAKGLEFDYVFVFHMDEGKLPYKKDMTESSIDEERRLAYVAFTRAIKGLFISCSNGEKNISRFVKDVANKCDILLDSFDNLSLNDFEEYDSNKKTNNKKDLDSIIFEDDLFDDD